MLKQLLQLKSDGTLKHLVQNGLMSAKVFSYLEIYMWVDARERATSKNLSDVVTDAEIAFRVSRATIWRALRVIKSID